jgi:glutathione synthase/RimK-type ligase-like ATP-grasp enzyme
MITKKTSTPNLLFARAQQMGLQPAWVIEDGLFVVSTDDGEKFVNHSSSSLNSHLSTGIAKNKYLTRLILERNKLANIAYMSPKTMSQAQAFLKTHKKIVSKPRGGMGSKGIRIIDTPAQLEEVNISKVILEKYIQGKELRFLVFGDKVIAVHESEYGLSVEPGRELERISYPQSEWNQELCELSVKITKIIGLQFSAVDYLLDINGKAHILEVNSAPGLKWFHSPSSGPSVDVAKIFMTAFVSDS